MLEAETFSGRRGGRSEPVVSPTEEFNNIEKNSDQLADQDAASSTARPSRIGSPADGNAEKVSGHIAAGGHALGDDPPSDGTIRQGTPHGTTESTGFAARWPSPQIPGPAQKRNCRNKRACKRGGRRISMELLAPCAAPGRRLAAAAGLRAEGKRDRPA